MLSYNPYYANYLAHYGTKEHSGRYPFGSGDRPYQHEAGGAYKKKYAKRTNKFLASSAKKKIKSDFKEGKYSKEEKDTLIKGVKDVYKNEKVAIKNEKLGMNKNEYYQNTTGEFRDTHSKSRIVVDALIGGLIPEGIRHITLSNASRQYDRLPKDLQSKVDTYINEAKKTAIDQISNNLNKIKNEPDKSFKENKYGYYRKETKLDDGSKIDVAYDKDDVDSNTTHAKFKEYSDTFEKNKNTIVNGGRNEVIRQINADDTVNDSNDVIRKNIITKNAFINKDGTYDVTYWADKYVGDHSFDITIDKNGKVKSVSLDG